MHFVAGAHDLADHLVTGYHRIMWGRGATFDFVQFGMAHTAGVYFDQHLTVS
jgi:hypothetical protein